MSRLPTRAQWTAACRAAAADPGSWHQVAGGGWGVMSPVYVDHRCRVTVHGHAGEVATTVDEVRLRLAALETLRGVDMEEIEFARMRGFELVLGRVLPVLDRGRLHARTDVDDIARLAGSPASDAVRMASPPHFWQATRRRGRLLLIVPGGEAGARRFAPMGTMTVDAPDHVLLHRAEQWDLVTAALLQAAASGADPIDAVAAAVGTTGWDLGAG